MRIEGRHATPETLCSPLLILGFSLFLLRFEKIPLVFGFPPRVTVALAVSAPSKSGLTSGPSDTSVLVTQRLDWPHSFFLIRSLMLPLKQ